MTTAPFPGQPAAAHPAVPPRGHVGLLAVSATGIVVAVLGSLRADPDVGALVLYCRDVTSRAPKPGVDAELLELSLSDPVTGLPNRAALVRRLGAVQREAPGRPFALALIGLSGLDSDVLTPTTGRLTRGLRGEDWLARGKDGDFAVLVDLSLNFQPVVDVVMSRTVSVEALLRWRHPLFGEISPTEFVPLAEESPLITDVGRRVLREACATVAALEDTELSVAVNVSARQFRCGELVPDVVAALEDSGLPASRLVVEITESVLLDDAHVIEDLSVLRQLGVRVAGDDFGTGWSSLAYLVGMPVDVLKTDQYFLANVEHDSARQAMCRAVLNLGSSLGLPIVVEGVTCPAVVELLRDMGHRYLQGYVFSRPLEAEQLVSGAWRAAAVPAVAP